LACGRTGGACGLRSVELEGVEEEEAEPSTRPWPPKEGVEEEKGLFIFFMRPFILSFISPIDELRGKLFFFPFVELANERKNGNREERRKWIGPTGAGNQRNECC
jgi:hypothetical protein